MEIDIQLTSGVFESYRRLAYEVHYALAEFVDNALDSLLTWTGPSQTSVDVSIVHRHSADGFFQIRDNAQGFSASDLVRAFEIGTPAPEESLLSRYGLGMKTAAFWLGNKWRIDTTRYGEAKKRSVSISLEHIRKHGLTLSVVEEPASPDEHYTDIRIWDLNHEVRGGRIRSLKANLSSIYRNYIKSGQLKLTWNSETVEAWGSEVSYRVLESGERAEAEVDTRINGKRVRGTIGVLDPGSRRLAGFALMHNDRVVRGQPNAWRPAEIFGAEGRNDLLNQRLIAELQVDDFEVSHTKNAINFTANDEEELVRHIRTKYQYLIALARATKSRRLDHEQRRAMLEKQAVGDFAEVLIAPELLDSLNQWNLPEVARDLSIDRVSERAEETELQVRGRVYILAFEADGSPSQSYMGLSERPNGATFITINLAHPYPQSLSTKADLVTHLVYSLVDALSIRETEPSCDSDYVTRFIGFRDQVLRAYATAL